MDPGFPLETLRVEDMPQRCAPASPEAAASST
jgi:hypothetical protein